MTAFVSLPRAHDQPDNLDVALGQHGHNLGGLSPVSGEGKMYSR
jgi:hypothetical protein